MAFLFRKSAPKRGFTLIELLIVVAIMGILFAAVAFIASEMIRRARVARAQGDLNRLAKAIRQVEIDTGLYPAKDPSTDCGLVTGTSNEINLFPGQTNFANSGLVTNFTDSVSSWKGPYMEEADFSRDPWGGYYIYDGDYQCVEDVPGCEEYIGGGTNEKAVYSVGPNKSGYDEDDIVIIFCSR